MRRRANGNPFFRQTVPIANAVAYSGYLLLFPVGDAGTANSMPITEAAFEGVRGSTASAGHMEDGGT